MNNKEWDTIIENKSALLNIDLREVWRYRDLLAMYVKRDIITFYKQTILGPLWFVIQPLFTTIMFMFVFGGIAGISTDGIPQAVFYLAGLVCWNYFQDCLSKCADTFNANQAIFGKVYFPRLVVPLSIVISNLIKMTIQFALFLVVYIYYFASGIDFQINAAICLVPLLIVMLGGLGLGFGLGFRNDYIFYDNQVPRFAISNHFWCTALDVCHSCHLSTFSDERHLSKVYLGVSSQSIDSHS